MVDLGKKGQRIICSMLSTTGPLWRLPHFKYLGVQIIEDLTWSAYTEMFVRKAQQCLYYLCSLRKFRLFLCLLTLFNRSTTESILTCNITVWYRNTNCLDGKALKMVVQSAEHATGEHLQDLQDIYIWSCREKFRRTIKDSSHTNKDLFSLLRSGKHYCSMKINTERFRMSVFIY